MNDLSTALAVLSAMITPAVLISACASLILTTSQRLGRVIDRTRRISARFQEVARTQAEDEFLEEEHAVLFDQIGRATRRSRLLQQAMSSLYLALSIFVATSVAIGIVAILGLGYAWIPTLLGIAGAGLLLYASFLLIAESRVALTAVNDEMDYVLRQSRYRAPAELLQPKK